MSINNRVVVAMSGGVDSSVTAALLVDQGYDCIGLFMRTGVSETAESCDTSGHQGCCSALDAGDARRVADQLGIPFYALNFEEQFEQIIDYFCDEYLAGRTPNPCVMCNNWLKFGRLWEYAEQVGAGMIATGHYARAVRGAAGMHLHRAVDMNKDQSYVLSGLHRDILEHVMFPLGDMPKEQVRQIALDRGLRVHNKPDSQEICFVPDRNYINVIRQRRAQRETGGDVVDERGRVLARHDGYEGFTIGQRRGLGVAVGEPRYVVEIQPDTRNVVIGPDSMLLAAGLRAQQMNWLVDVAEGEAVDCQAQIRYLHRGVDAVATREQDGQAKVLFVQPERAVTPGQAVALYQGDRVIAGGWINEVIRDVSF